MFSMVLFEQFIITASGRHVREQSSLINMQIVLMFVSLDAIFGQPLHPMGNAGFISECEQNENAACENDGNIRCRLVTQVRQTAFGYAANIRAIRQLSGFQREFAYDMFRCRHTCFT